MQYISVCFVEIPSLFQTLINWINDVLADHRIIVKDLQEDLYDGLILQKLVGEHKTHTPLYKMFACKE